MSTWDSHSQASGLATSRKANPAKRSHRSSALIVCASNTNRRAHDSPKLALLWRARCGNPRMTERGRLAWQSAPAMDTRNYRKRRGSPRSTIGYATTAPDDDLTRGQQARVVVQHWGDLAGLDGGLHPETVPVVIPRSTAAGPDGCFHLEAVAVVIPRSTAAGLDARLDLQARVLLVGLHVSSFLFLLPPGANPEIAAGVPRAKDDEGAEFRGSAS